MRRGNLPCAYSSIGWSLVGLGAFIILNGVFGHLWYEGGVFHEGSNMLAAWLGGERVAEAEIPIEAIEEKVPFMEYGYLANFVLTLGVVAWSWWRSARKLTKEVVAVFTLFLLWDASLIPVGIKPM